MSIIAGKQDYIGFTYNGIHSSELGIMRISDGSRFNQNLLPTMQDKTAIIPGGDGTYYFGSYYTQKQFSISFAFDDLTEEQITKIKRTFGDKGIHDLIFDEEPYKVYSAKVTGTATLKHIPFAEGANNRLYKGEGTVQFTCYTPFARCRAKYLDDKIYSEYGNKNEWATASGLKKTQGNYDKVSGGVILTYNPGDLNSDWTLEISIPSSGVIPALEISAQNAEGETFGPLYIKEVSKQGNDTKIVVNSKLNLIEGFSDNIKTGNLYNHYVKEGNFFKIPRGEGSFTFTAGAFIENSTPLVYNYYYF